LEKCVKFSAIPLYNQFFSAHSLEKPDLICVCYIWPVLQAKHESGSHKLKPNRCT